MADREVEEGNAIVVSDPWRFTVRCARYLRLEKIGAPDMIVDEEARLIEEAAKVLTGAELAHAMRDFPSAVARLQRIEAQVEAEHPPYPEDDQ